MNSSIWEHFASGSFSPGTSPAFLSGPGAAELARLRQELDEANGTIKQWEESWKQAKQVLGPTPTCSAQCLVVSSPSPSYTAGIGWGKQGPKEQSRNVFALPHVGGLILPVRMLPWLAPQAWDSIWELFLEWPQDLLPVSASRF